MLYGSGLMYCPFLDLSLIYMGIAIKFKFLQFYSFTLHYIILAKIMFINFD